MNHSVVSIVIPSPGSTVTIEAENYSAKRLNPSWFPNEPATKFYTGTVVTPSKWDRPDTINLTTGDPRFPVRSISYSSIVAINGKQFVPPAKQQTRTVTVAGSKGNVYTVTITGNHRTCTCSSFQFRRKCKHVDATLKGAS